MVLKGKLKVAKKTIENMRGKVDRSAQEVKALHSKLSLVEVHLGATGTRLRHAEGRTYKTKFGECKALLVQILSSTKAYLL